jgi:hypothetical protein
MSDNNDILPQLLEEELKSIRACNNELKREIGNLKQEIDKLSILNESSNVDKREYSTKFKDHESRIRLIENIGHDIATNRHLTENGMKNLETLLTTKLDMIDIETKKNYEN